MGGPSAQHRCIPVRSASIAFSSQTLGICRVSPGGVVDSPTEYDRLSGTCVVQATATSTADWESVDVELEIELGRPTVVARFASGQGSVFEYVTGLRVPVAVEVIDNDGDAGFWLAPDGDCMSEQVNAGPSTIMFDVIFYSAGACTVTLQLDSPGVFHFAEDLPPPLVLTAE